MLRRSEHGTTKPFICRGDDGNTYFVKGSAGTGNKDLIHELISAKLAELIGLPIAPFAVVEVPQELINLQFLPDINDLGSGPAFGSEEMQLTELTYAGIDYIEEKLQQDVLIFDWWIRNNDRCLSKLGGNPNLFVNQRTGELVIIDHNLAFDFLCQKRDFNEYHTFKKQLWQLSGDFNRRDEYNERFERAIKAWPEILQSIPIPWLFADKEQTLQVNFNFEQAHNLLKQFKCDDFWIWR